MREDEKSRTGQKSAASSRSDSPSSASSSNAFRPAQAGLDDHGNDDREGAPLSPDMQQFIGRQLRAVYDDVAKQPVPDRFLELMRQLDNKTGVR